MNHMHFVDLGSWFFLVFAVGTVLGSVLDSVLGWMNRSKNDVKDGISRIHSLGDEAKKLFSSRKIGKAVKYRNEACCFDDMAGSVRSGITSLLVLFGVLPTIVHLFMGCFPGIRVVWCWIMASALGVLASSALSAPFDYYREFGIDAKYGLSSYSRGTFFSDIAKSLAISLVLLVAIQLIVDFSVSRISVFGIASVAAFSFWVIVAVKAFQWLSMNVFLRMFNKIKPLSDKKLSRKISELCKKCGIRLKSVEVIDASRRTNRSNAFVFGGLGGKRIILYDTLVKNLSNDEVVSVIAHELGHAKLHHLAIGNLQLAIYSCAWVSAVLALILEPEFYHAFGYSWVTAENLKENMVIGLGVAITFMSSVTWVLSPLSNWISRKMEYAADRYAARNCKDAKSLETALLKLASENLSDSVPHPAYEFVNFTHPSIANRIESIRRSANGRS